MTAWETAALAGSALAAGLINAVAGGGTLLTFPALLLTGAGAMTANATSTFALTLGTAGSLFGFRNQWASTRQWIVPLVPVSIAAGFLGSWLVKAQGEAVFRQVVPWLLLFATSLFLLQNPIKRWRDRRFLARASRALHPDSPDRSVPAGPPSGLSLPASIALQAGVALYGGYFGAGIGILMLAVLGFMGMTDIHRMNALKNLLASVINGTASLYFACAGLVDWPRAGIMLTGAVAGYWLGAHYSQKIPQPAVRALVIATGFFLTAVMIHRLHF